MGKKKTKTSSTETNHSVSTPNNPLWSEQGVGSVMTGVSGLAAADPYAFVVPAHELELQAGRRASSLGGDAEFKARLDGILSAPAPSVSAQSLLDGLERYQNPYRTQVVDAASADFDAEAGRTRASQALSLAGQGAFGGSGAALTLAQTEGELARARNTQVSKLLSDMFMHSASLAGQDADRRQQAAQLNAQNALQDAQFKAQALSDIRAADRADVTAQAAIGQQLRAADQEWRQSPLTLLAKRADIISGLPLSLFRGETNDSTGTRTGTETQSGASIGELADLIKSVVSLKSAFGPSGGASGGN